MKTALLIEDYEPMRALLRQVLQKAFVGIDVKEVDTVKDARQWIQQQSFNIALIDLNLPDGSGVDIIKQLKRDHPQTYCVVATVFDDDHNLFAALGAGAHGYILKEEPMEHLIVLLEGIVKGEPPLSAGIARRLLRYFNKTPSNQETTCLLSPREKDVLKLIAEGKQQ